MSAKEGTTELFKGGSGNNYNSPATTVNVIETAAAVPGHSESLPDRAESSVAWELGSAAHKMSDDYCTSACSNLTRSPLATSTNSCSTGSKQQ
jgi:hypothetical protein